MKKITRIIGLMCMAAVVAFSASSCKKTEENASFTMRLTQVQGFNDDRAYIDVYDNCLLKWNEDDALKVYNLAEDYTESVVEEFVADPGAGGQTTTTFSGNPVGASKGVGFFFFYPSYMASGVLEEGNRETFTVEDEQIYDEEFLFDPNSLVMARKVQNDFAEDGVMEHIFGFLHLKVTKGTAARIKSIVVTDLHHHLTGSMSLLIPAVNSETFETLYQECVAQDPSYASDLYDYLHNQLHYEANGEGYTITLNCEDADNGEGVLVNADTQHFVISLRPGALWDGFTITVNYMDEQLPATVLNYDAHSYCIRPAWFTNLTVGI